MERREIRSDIYHMKCDVCGKEEDIVDRDLFRPRGWAKRHWSKVTFTHNEKRVSSPFRKNRPVEHQLIDNTVRRTSRKILR